MHIESFSGWDASTVESGGVKKAAYEWRQGPIELWGPWGVHVIKTENLKTLRTGLMGNLGSFNALWVRMQHADKYVLVSRRRWIDRWRDDRLGVRRIRAKRKCVFPPATKVFHDHS